MMMWVLDAGLAVPATLGLLANYSKEEVKKDSRFNQM